MDGILFEQICLKIISATYNVLYGLFGIPG